LSDEIRLVLPAEEDFRHIAHLVVGGLGVRLDLTYDHLEDLQVALEAVLACRDDDGEIVVTVNADDGSIRTSVGPFAAGDLEELQHDGGELGLRRVLETVTDGFDVDERDGAAWVELKKATA
jgi:anti-sigma regulatory factor (Ser/Thr protein kinase)